MAATKPLFFTERRPFLERVFDGGHESVRTAYTLERGRVYENGNLRDFERMVNARGERVLYVGDHIFGDILRSKKDSAWRTLMIVQEMEAELAAMDQTRARVADLDARDRDRERLEDELRARQGQYRTAARGLGEEHEDVVAQRRVLDHLKGRAARRPRRGGAAPARRGRRDAPPVLGLALQAGGGAELLRRPGGGVRLPLHLAGVEPRALPRRTSTARPAT